MARFEEVDSRDEDFDEAKKAFDMALVLAGDDDIRKRYALSNIAFLYSKRGMLATSAADKYLEMVDNLKIATTSSAGPPKNTVLPTSMLARLTNLAEEEHLARENVHPSEQLSMYAAVIDMLPDVAALVREYVRHQQIITTSEAVMGGVDEAVKPGEIEMAVKWMERVRCWVWNQINQLRTPLEVQDYNKELADRFERISRRLETIGFRPIRQQSEFTSSDPKVSPKEGTHQHLMLIKERD
ncbi:hypothetical protein CPB83DRAFT_5487 [Crepidotus variabilis]|uniref:Uncharacterized protein n=1 Tax=Crepidotus variabilis TaxID=179855 RepID=A0A9P6EU92_9AGAR|nr:hypothetical protein CPB83DRAFT_5487 [Crepidotus variabilis]